MKKAITILIGLFLMLPVVLKAQNDMPGGMQGRMGRLMQLEQMKLIDLLNMDEETSIKFFARKREYMQKQKKLLDQKKEYINELRNAIKEKNSSLCDSLLNKIFEVERENQKNRENFVHSLSDILTKEQIAKVIIFEAKFKDELKKFLMHRRMHR